MKTVILVEGAEDAPKALKATASARDRVVFVSLSPGASGALEEAGVVYRTAGSYSDTDAIYRQGIENFTVIDAIAGHLDQELASMHGMPVTPARYAFYNLKILFDVLFTAVSVIQAIIRIEEPDKVCLFSPPAAHGDCGRYAFSDETSVYAAVLSLPGWNVGISIQERDRPVNQYTASAARQNCAGNTVAERLLRRPGLFNLGLIQKRCGLPAALRACCNAITHPRSAPVILYESGYNWDDSLEELYAAGITRIYRVTDSAITFSPDEEARYREAVFAICTNSPECQNAAWREDIDVSSLLFDKIARIIGRTVTESLVTYPQMSRFIAGHNIRAVLLSVRVSGIGHALVRAARDRNVPVISWQHGGAGYGYHPLMPFIEYIDTDAHLVFGKGVAENYRTINDRINLKNPPEMVSVGSSSLDAIVKCESKPTAADSKRTILYVTTKYSQNLYAISSTWNPASYDEILWSIQRGIIDLAGQHPDDTFLIKLHPGHTSCEPLLSYARCRNISNLRFIIAEQSVQELLPEADIIIFDLVSTGILQVLQTDKPVLVYTGLTKMDSGAFNALARRCYVPNDEQTFLSACERYLSAAPHAPVDCTNTDFITAFGTCRNDGLSARRAVDAVHRVLKTYRAGNNNPG